VREGAHNTLGAAASLGGQATTTPETAQTQNVGAGSGKAPTKGEVKYRAQSGRSTKLKRAAHSLEGSRRVTCGSRGAGRGGAPRKGATKQHAERRRSHNQAGAAGGNNTERWGTPATRGSKGTKPRPAPGAARRAAGGGGRLPPPLGGPKGQKAAKTRWNAGQGPQQGVITHQLNPAGQGCEEIKSHGWCTTDPRSVSACQRPLGPQHTHREVKTNTNVACEEEHTQRRLRAMGMRSNNQV
jgi:hypothetical protein